jgi:predicted amidohydrolase YtcJ
MTRTHLTPTRHLVRRLTTALAGVVALSACTPAPPAEPPADLLIINGRVFTGDADRGPSTAVAVRGSTIAAVGPTAELSRLQGPATTVIDARGGVVAPGFNDAHLHLLSGGFTLGQVDLAGLASLEAIQQSIRTFAAAHPDAPWVEGFGWPYAPFPDSSPTAAQLDAAVADRPAVMNCYDGHSLWVNTRALEAAGITAQTPDPPNGEIVRDPRTGRPTGHLKEAAADLVRRAMPPPTDDQRRAALRAAVTHAHRLGVTSVQNAGTSLSDMALLEATRDSGDLALRTYAAFRANGATTEADADAMVATWQRIGDERPTLKTGIVKMFADGVIESRTAALIDPYPGSGDRGTPQLSPDDLTRVVTLLDRRGLQVQIHATGDRGVQMALDAFAHAAQVNPAPARGRRHRIEHVETISEPDIARFQALGVIASMQPMHVVLGDMNSPTPSGPWPDNVGPERQQRAWAWRRIAQQGARVVFGSDWPVATLDPGPALWLATTRTGTTGDVPQAMPMADVLRAYTSEAAWASFDESRKGRLAPGQLADVVVLTSDVLSTPPATPDAVSVAATVFDGRVVFRKP